MNDRVLGKDGLTLGEMGLSCRQLGGDFGAMEEKTAMSILAAAVDEGVNFFDTADIYGGGRSEQWIGKFLKNCSSSVFVGTKFGRHPKVYPNGYSRESLLESVHGSLKRLGVKTLDLLQLHCIPMEVIRRGEIFNWLGELKKKGLIKHYGASVETVEEGLSCLEHKELSSLQVIFNIFRQKPAEELFPKAQEQGVGIIVRLPLASGLLSSNIARDKEFQKVDNRNYNRDGHHFNVGETFAGIRYEKGVEFSHDLKKMVPEEITQTQMALRWILDQEAVSVVIPGASSPEQVKENSSSSDLDPLPDSLREKINDYYNNNVQHHIRGVY